MSPLTLVVVIALGVAFGIAAALYVGTLFAFVSGALLVSIVLFLTFVLLRVSLKEGISLTKIINDGVRLYFRAIPQAWNMLTRPSELGDEFFVRRRIDGLVILFVCFVWAVVIVGAVLLVLFPT
ncbi:hypothetical protein [Candidatus Nitrotoga fabula]|uniref:Uncharacterized protein n=1 Tax=Candidatus Nitrotoga fabula TaxID=2182327 RepID=A0A916BEM0_9PROT|nr:hypothetical protein [Candidatus Nitrotoga fabula]CAE6739485.1 membrane hypothetical protein [Candidatus Nitrotoga fabula]